jgi:hypothetical protein
MGKVYAQGNWLIRVQGNEHPPIHAHVIHPDGRAIVYLDGSAINSGVPADVMALAIEWVLANTEIIRVEWARMNNPPAR